MNKSCENSESAQKNVCLQWDDVNKQILDKKIYSEETTVFDADFDSKVKLEVELKEDVDSFVYYGDFSRHLQQSNSVDSRSDSNHCRFVGNAKQGSELINKSVASCPANEIGGQKCDEVASPHWPTVKSELHPSSENSQQVVIWEDQSNSLCRHLKSISDGSVNDLIKEEPSENNTHICSYVLPEIYDYSSDSTWDNPQTDHSSQLTRVASSSGNLVLTQAEKKRLYRMRIKTENPSLWCSLKKKEAARKRELREKRRTVIFEMQRAMDQAEEPDPTDGGNHTMYLEALKERYPELWMQLMDALPATQLRNDQLYSERTVTSRRNVPKQAKMYRDVIEAQKKRLYRQRVKEERPEMYARQKERDAYSRSIQRHLLKKRIHGESNVSGENSCVPSKIPSVARSVPSQVCDNNPSVSQTKKRTFTFSGSLPLTNDDKAFAAATQSSMLWLWNDLDTTGPHGNHVPYSSHRKRPEALTEEQRLQKILKERIQLREKRKAYRLGMAPDKQKEFLEVERERLRVYRAKRKDVGDVL